MDDPITATRFYGDDENISVFSGPSILIGGQGDGASSILDTSDAAFKANNLSGQTWTFNWASANLQNSVIDSINGSAYAWVVSAPTVRQGDGKFYESPVSNDNGNKNEVGGAVFNITANYQVPAAPPGHVYSLHWIQAYSGFDIIDPNPTTSLDNGLAQGTSPFYDAGPRPGAPGGTAGTFWPGSNPSAWFLDVPYSKEVEKETNPVAYLTFQVALALDDYNITQNSNAVTLLGGVQWGYIYVAHDTPEPSSLAIWSALGALGIAARRRRRHSVRKRLMPLQASIDGRSGADPGRSPSSLGHRCALPPGAPTPFGAADE
ncbi:MAG TPA: hypothetical protein VMV10_24525 [Pirellulales bacterium]|nr:hypothetical protein [Pirellulales bacterium]